MTTFLSDSFDFIKNYGFRTGNIYAFRHTYVINFLKEEYK
jgi:hypothetical protein